MIRERLKTKWSFYEMYWENSISDDQRQCCRWNHISKSSGWINLERNVHCDRRWISQFFNTLRLLCFVQRAYFPFRLAEVFIGIKFSTSEKIHGEFCRIYLCTALVCPLILMCIRKMLAFNNIRNEIVSYTSFNDLKKVTNNFE